VSLYKRGKVYWSAIWIDGVRQMRSLETSNRRRAEILEQRWCDELHTQRFQLPNLKPDMPFGELYARFLAEGDVKAYHKDRAKLFLPFFAEMPIGQITKNDVARYRKQRHSDHLKRQDTDDPKPLSETTVNRDIEVIQENPGRGRSRADPQAGTEGRRDARSNHSRGTRTLEASAGEESPRIGLTLQPQEPALCRLLFLLREFREGARS
jgi:hypothetical protein